MQTHARKAAQVKTAGLVSEPLPLPGAEEEDYPRPTAAEIEATFRAAYAAQPTQPLPRIRTTHERRAERRVTFALSLFVCAVLGGVLLGILTYPTVTIEVSPVSRHVSTTASLALVTRTLSPVTITRTGSTPTTGHGHQDARRASGTLTLYNGLFTPQTLPAGAVFVAQRGVQVATSVPVTIPASDPSTTPPQLGVASVSGVAVLPGSAGNLAAYAINTTVSNGVAVKNTSAFAGGRDARDYQAVARADLARVTAALQATLSAQVPQAFSLHPGEAVTPMACTFAATADHPVGQEARTLTVTARDTCTGLAYQQDDLQQQATAALTTETRPGPHFQLAGPVAVQVVRVSPFTVLVRGLWRYDLSEDEEQSLAQHIAGESVQAARAYLLHTDLFTSVTVPQPLPRDPQHIRFVVVVMGGMEGGAGR